MPARTRRDSVLPNPVVKRKAPIASAISSRCARVVRVTDARACARSSAAAWASTPSAKTAICAAETAGGWVAGLGIGGAEDFGNLRDFAWSYDCAREAGLGLTAHAGEWGGPESVRDALSLGVLRIGHGIRASEDADLMHELAQRQVTLEVCPGSNVALGAVGGWGAHPIARLADAGVRVTVSTDDPPFFHTTLSHEYQMLADHFGWAEDEFRQMNLWAVDAAFCDETTKTRLRKDLT